MQPYSDNNKTPTIRAREGAVVMRVNAMLAGHGDVLQERDAR
jgi:hypothetical protein